MHDHFLIAPFTRSFFEDHLICRRNVSYNTIQSYRDAIKLLLTFAARTLGKLPTALLVTDVDENLVIAFLTDLEVLRKNSIQTRNYRLAAIKALFEYIAAREPMLLGHCAQITTIPRKRGAILPEVSHLEKDQMTAILQAVDQSTRLGRRDHALLLFLYNTGARVQEAADAQTEWLTLSPPYKVQLLGKGRKLRTCPLWDTTVSHLRRLLAERHSENLGKAYLFVNRHGHQLSRSGIEGIIQRHVATAAKSLPSLSAKKVTPHTFRHTTAMHLLQSGVEINVIRSWLGHVSLDTTNRYVEIDMATKTKALEACRIGGRPEGPAPWKTSPDILAWLERL